MEKLINAYYAASASTYMLSTQMECLAANTHQSDRLEGIVAVNPTSVTQRMRLRVPEGFMVEKRQLSARRGKHFLVYSQPQTVDCGTLELPPFSYHQLPMAELTRRKEAAEQSVGPWSITEGVIETPFYRITIAPHTGRILQLYDLLRETDLLDESSPWAFFEAVCETVDARYEPEVREAIFERDIERNNQNIPGWKCGWHACHTGSTRVNSWRLEKGGEELCIYWESELAGFKSLCQKITFFADTPQISLWAGGEKLPVETPESLYFAFPLKLESNWECRFDSAGQFVKLDDEQLGKVSRDYFTVDKSVSMIGKERCITLLCPDAPMVQAGNFYFGRCNEHIPRQENPLLLAWPMNNYWNTNFVANQSGREEFRYGLCVHDTFDAAAVHSAACQAQELCVLGALNNCVGEKEGQLLCGEGDAVALYIQPAKENGAFMLTLSNPNDAVACYHVTLPDGRAMDAAWVSPQEKELDCIAKNQTSLTIPVPPRKLGIVKVSVHQ